MPSDVARNHVRSCRRWLARHFPMPYPVRVQWEAASVLRELFEAECYGGYLVYDNPTRGIIYLAHESNRFEAVDTLIHEWAHLFRYLIPKYDATRDPHDAVWASIYHWILRHWNDEAPSMDEGTREAVETPAF